MRTSALLLALAVAVAALPRTADAQPIYDPENPGAVGGAPETGAIVDPENPGVIVDPQNTGLIADPENSGAIVDPQNTALTAPAPAAAPPPSRPVLFRGAYSASLSSDLAREDAFEHTAGIDQSLSLRLRYGFHARWTLTLEGSLRWWMSGPGEVGAPPFAVDGARWEGRLRPQLRDAVISGRAGRWLLRFGNQSIVWGSTDITRPSDVINPRDFTLGFDIVPGESRTPTPALVATRVLERGTWQWLYVPVFVPHRIDLFEGALPIASLVQPVLGPAPAEVSGALTGLDGVDATTSEALTRVLLTTDAPDATLRNGSAGTRLAYSHRGWDLALGYFYGFDRTPFAEVSAEGLELLGEIAEDGLSPEALAVLAQRGLEQVSGGETLFSSSYARMHTVQHDGVRYAGPVGFRWEVVFQPARTLYLATLQPVRRPMLSGALGVGYESGGGDFVWSTEVFHQRALLGAGDEEALLGTDALWVTATLVNLGLGAFGGLSGTRWSDVSLQLAAIYLPDGSDLVLQPSVRFAATEALTLALDATVVSSFGDAVTLGDAADGVDAISLSLTRAF